MCKVTINICVILTQLHKIRVGNQPQWLCNHSHITIQIIIILYLYDHIIIVVGCLHVFYVITLGTYMNITIIINIIYIMQVNNV